MFNEDGYVLSLAEELLMNYSLSEIFEINDLDEVDVLAILVRGGHIGEPSVVVERFETEGSGSTKEDFSEDD